jgi:hypothetical protein
MYMPKVTTNKIIIVREYPLSEEEKNLKFNYLHSFYFYFHSHIFPVIRSPSALLSYTYRPTKLSIKAILPVVFVLNI